MRRLKAVTILLLAFLIVNVCAGIVKADMGPKPSVKLTVTDAPSKYYVALLTNFTNKDKINSELKVNGFDSETVDAYLNEFFYDGWVFHKSPVGNSIFESNAEGVYMFTYMVPDPFRVILITEDGRVILSDPIDQKEYNADCTFDVNTGKVTEESAHKLRDSMIYIIVCYLFTLIFELTMLKIFRYPFNRRNLVSFFLINTLTQLTLNVIIFTANAGVFIIVMYFFLELLVIIAEGLFYLFTLVDSDGNVRKGRNFLYSIAANLFSIIMGIILLYIFTAIIGSI